MNPEPLVIYVPSAIALAGIAALVAFRRGRRSSQRKPKAVAGDVEDQADKRKDGT